MQFIFDFDVIIVVYKNLTSILLLINVVLQSSFVRIGVGSTCIYYGITIYLNVVMISFGVKSIVYLYTDV